MSIASPIPVVSIRAKVPRSCLIPASEVNVPFPEALAEAVALVIITLLVVVVVLFLIVAEVEFPLIAEEVVSGSIALEVTCDLLSSKRALKEGNSIPTIEQIPLAYCSVCS